MTIGADQSAVHNRRLIDGCQCFRIITGELHCLITVSGKIFVIRAIFSAQQQDPDFVRSGQALPLQSGIINFYKGGIIQQGKIMEEHGAFDPDGFFFVSVRQDRDQFIVILFCQIQQKEGLRFQIADNAVQGPFHVGCFIGSRIFGKVHHCFRFLPDGFDLILFDRIPERCLMSFVICRAQYDRHARKKDQRIFFPVVHLISPFRKADLPATHRMPAA